MSRPRRRFRGPRRAGITLATFVLTSAGLAVAAHGQNPPIASDSTAVPNSQAELAEAKPITLDGLAPRTHEITLLTGDLVRLTPVAGQFGVEIEPAASRATTDFLTQTTPDGTYVFPSDVMPAVMDERVDEELFNVTYLAENGYADEKTDSLPVIVQYAKGRSGPATRRAADTLPATTPGNTLESVSASAVTVNKDGAAEFWAAVRGADTPRMGVSAMGRGVTRLWLDRKVEAVLDDSVPMVGAPSAWEAGLDGTGVTVAVLDSGIDPEHPDLSSKIAGEQSFVPGVESAFDGAGHGTHVASTIAGSGAASDGQYRGVAPGAQLINGKVLNDNGSGQLSWIVEGMEWAAANADVVNMSLGACCSDGTDPMSLAVNTLTQQTGALFVVSAGNSGSAGVSSPGTADSALTVAAVDKSDQMAYFSSRGPRLGDAALKPDLAGPGVSIVAARSSTFTIPDPVHVGEYYTTLSGTSMAAPHVAGAAAILAQQYPDWTPAQLKSALMSTSVDAGHDVYEQGAGRLDVARATTQKVIATTANIDYRHVSGNDPAPADREVRFANHGDSAVTLSLATTLRSVSGTPADGVLSSPATVMVPARGTAAVTVTADAASLNIGNYTGMLVATANGVQVHVPIGLVREPERYNLVVRTIGRDGQPANPYAQDTLDVAGEQGLVPGAAITDEGEVTIRVVPGTYSITQLMSWTDQDSRTNTAWLSNPEVTVTGDTEITLDARVASQIQFETPLPSQATTDRFVTSLRRSTASGEPFTSDLSAFGTTRIWATPTQPVRTGDLWFRSSQKLAPAEVTMTVSDGPGIALDPRYYPHHEDSNGHPGFKHFTDSALPLVDVGLGNSEDIAGLDLNGKLVMLHTDMAAGVFGPECGVRIERVELIRDAGAAGILAFPGEGVACTVPLPTQQEPFTGPLRPTDIPIATVSTWEGLALRAALAYQPVTIGVEGEQIAPYTYNLTPYEDGRIPGSLRYEFQRRHLATVDLTIQQPIGPDAQLTESVFALRADDTIPHSTSTSYVHSAATRREYVGPLSADVAYVRYVGAWVPGRTGADSNVVYTSAPQVFDRPMRVEQRYLPGPRTPGALPVSPAVVEMLGDTPAIGRLAAHCQLCRQGDNLYPQLLMTALNNGMAHSDLYNGNAITENFRDFTLLLTRDGEPVTANPPFLGVLPSYTLPAESGSYQLTADGPNTDVTWTFQSDRPTENGIRPGYRCTHGALFGTGDLPCRAEQVLFAGYDLGDTIDQANRVEAGRKHTFEVTVGNPQTLTAPEVASVKVWTSVDDGQTWTPAKLKGKNGEYDATARYPRLSSTSGAVSLRIEAADTEGNSLEMITLRAFELR